VSLKEVHIVSEDYNCIAMEVFTDFDPSTLS